MTETLRVSAPAIHCGGCGNSIQRSLSKLTGVENSEVDVDAKTVTVAYDPGQVSKADILLRLDLAGYAAQEIPA